jgi:uncharacterized membrane protein (DUF4010 family)
LVELSNRYTGANGVYVVAFVSGVADVDAIVLSLSALAKNGLLSSTAHYAILFAIIANSLTKTMLVFILGNSALFRLVFFYYLISVGAFVLTALVIVR